jgi:hypothetical protein
MAAVERAAAGQAWVLRGLAPLGVLMVVTALDVAVGPGQPLLGLTVIAPLLAATITSCPMTLGYADGARRNSPGSLSEIPHPGNEGDARSLTLVVSCVSAACRAAAWVCSAISRAWCVGAGSVSAC